MKCDASKRDIVAQAGDLKAQTRDVVAEIWNVMAQSKNCLLFHLLTYQTGNISNIFTSVCEAAGPMLDLM
jgi:hypothetical protein